MVSLNSAWFNVRVWSFPLGVLILFFIALSSSFTLAESATTAPLRSFGEPDSLTTDGHETVLGVASVDFSPDGNLLASATMMSAQVWNVRSGEEVQQWKMEITTHGSLADAIHRVI